MLHQSKTCNTAFLGWQVWRERAQFVTSLVVGYMRQNRLLGHLYVDSIDHVDYGGLVDEEITLFQRS